MRVLFVAPENTQTGGSFLSMVELCKQLRLRYGVEPIVITSTRGDGVKLLQENDIRYFALPMFFPTYSLRLNIRDVVKSTIKICLMPLQWYSKWKIKKLLQQEAIDIVHINNVFVLSAAAAALETKNPIVWHVREMFDADYHVSFIQGNEYAWKLLRAADAVIAISNVVSRTYKQVLGAANNMETVYNGISMDFYNEHDILNGPTVTFACIGQFIEHKNHIELIEACRLLKEAGIENYKLILLGKGYLKSSLQKLVLKYGLNGQVTFSGTRSDIPEFLGSCDVVCVPSSSESFGRTFVEGMLSGCLLIGADSSLSAAGEIIENNETGILYQSGNPQDLAEKMKSIISGQNREVFQRIARRGQKSAAQRFTSEKNADAIMNVYRNVLKKRMGILPEKTEERAI